MPARNDSIIVSIMGLSCSFCLQFQHRIPAGVVLNHFGWELDRIIYETSNFIITAAAGCFIEGYLLVVPKRHILSFSELSLKEQDEYFGIKEKIINFHKLFYSGVTNFFEHGTCCDSRGANCIDHAHMHVIPLTRSIRSQFIKDFESHKLISFYFPPINVGYLYLEENSNHPPLMAKIPSGAPSQYFRRLAARSMGNTNEWNWRIHFFAEHFKTTVQKGKSYGWS